MITKAAGAGLQHIYKTREEIEEAAKRLGLELQKGHNTLYFHEGTRPTTIHLYNERTDSIRTEKVR